MLKKSLTQSIQIRNKLGKSNSQLSSPPLSAFNQIRTMAALQSNVNVGKLDELGEPRFLENVKLFFERAAKKTNIPDDMFKFIQSCKNVVRFNIPLRMDDGTIRTIPCYR
jgi:hypothetical protein